MDKCTTDAYQGEITKVLQFLDGDYQQVLDKMESRMQALSEQLRFEDAMVVRDQRVRIHQLLEESKQTITQRKDRDFWGIEQIGNVGVYAVSAYRRGTCVL